jgi:hypothetical protein
LSASLPGAYLLFRSGGGLMRQIVNKNNSLKADLMHFIRLSILYLLCLWLAGCHDPQNLDLLENKADVHRDDELRHVTRKLAEANPDHIQPYVGNQRYWQYKGDPVLLLGASDEDNLFNHPDIWPFGIESHLDLMVRYGGNYIRNTMSSRDHGNVWAFGRLESQQYDLNVWNETYWSRLVNLLELAHARDIIVQIELWDRFDYARAHWNDNPFNPINNVNYDADSSGLPETIDSHPGRRENPFFRSVPELANNTIVLNYQQKYMEKLLSITLDFPNVLYCISNETNESDAWSEFWAYFVRNRAREKGVLVHVTEMYDAWDLSHPQHKMVLNKPDLYTYLDISQNNHQQGQTHWDNAQALIARHVIDSPRPVNSVKIYGGTKHGGNFEEGTRRMWRNIFGGFASSRFHRASKDFSPSGIGLTSLAQTHLASMRMLASQMNVFVCRPSNHLLSRRESDEAYAFAEEGNQYAVYFPDGGSVQLDLTAASGTFSRRWLHIMKNEWQIADIISGGTAIDLSPPGKGPFVVLLLKLSENAGQLTQ